MLWGQVWVQPPILRSTIMAGLPSQLDLAQSQLLKYTAFIRLLDDSEFCSVPGCYLLGLPTTPCLVVPRSMLTSLGPLLAGEEGEWMFPGAMVCSGLPRPAFRVKTPPRVSNVFQG